MVVVIQRRKDGDNFNVFSQIIAVADVFHAMTVERVIVQKNLPFKVIEMIKKKSLENLILKLYKH